MSSTGECLIYYAIVSQDIFPILNDFIVHEMYSCSPHVPIQINLKVKYKQPDSPDDSFCVNKLIWDDNKVDEFRQQINSDIVTFEIIVDRIISSETDINQGVSEFADVLYKTSLNIYGTSKQIGRVNKKNARKFKRPRFTKECELARREPKRANKIYAKNKSEASRESVISKRKLYCSAKRRAGAKFKFEQKSLLHNNAHTQPQTFWREIRKIRGNRNTRSNLTSQEFSEHFKNLYSSENIFVNEDIERELKTDSLDSTQRGSTRL